MPARVGVTCRYRRGEFRCTLGIVIGRWVGAAALAAVVLLVSGCTPPPPDVPGPSTEQLSEFSQKQLALLWDDMTVPEGLNRPRIEPIRTISNAEYGTVINECLDGFRDRDFRNLYGHELIAEQPQSVQGGLNETVSWYVCSAQYPFDPTGAGLFSTEQLEYLYDYNRRWVVPCMVLYGYDVGEIPKRADFVKQGLGGTIWSPVNDLYRDLGMTVEDFDELDSKCDPFPDYLFPGL